MAILVFTDDDDNSLDFKLEDNFADQLFLKKVQR